MRVIMNLSDVFTPDASALENAKVLQALMVALIDCDVAYLEHHKAPKLYSSRVTYGRTNEWERIPDVLARGEGDCKSLAAWRIAELRREGERAEPVFRWRMRQSGISDYHILVARGLTYEDPSKVLGMNAGGRDENSYFGGRR